MTLSIEERKKRIIWMSRIIICVAFMFVFVVVPVADAESEFPYNWLEQINHGVFETINNNLYNSDYYTWVTDPDNALLRGIFLAIKGFSIVFIVGNSVTRMFTHLEHGQDATEVSYKTITEIGIGGSIVIYCDAIVDGIAAFAGFIINALVSGAMVGTGGLGLTLTQLTGAESGGWTWKISCFFVLFLPYIGSTAASVVAQFAAFSILFEICIRRVFTPFAISDIYGEGIRSPGVRYLKKYLATYMKVGICILVCAIGTAFVQISTEQGIEQLGGYLQYCFHVIAIEFTAIGVMMKGGEWANESLGV